MPKHLITPAPTSVTAIVTGDNEGSPPVAVKSYADFAASFGNSGMLATVVRQFFEQGGTDAIIVPGSGPEAAQSLAFNILCFAFDNMAFEEATDLCASKQAFAIFQASAPNDIGRALVQLGGVETHREWAAGYFPHFDQEVYPCGAVAGLWARTDREQGVWTAAVWPGGGILHGVQLPDRGVIDHDQFMVLMKAGANGIGTKDHTYVWSDFTLAQRDEKAWQWSVHVRRTLVYIEQSLRNGLGWVTQEKNGPELWTSVTESVSDFLEAMKAKGAFSGAGYKIACDATNNKPGDHVLHIAVSVALHDAPDFLTVSVDMPAA